jgi:hypothetical protein
MTMWPQNSGTLTAQYQRDIYYSPPTRRTGIFRSLRATPCAISNSDIRPSSAITAVRSLPRSQLGERYGVQFLPVGQSAPTAPSADAVGAGRPQRDIQTLAIRHSDGRDNARLREIRFLSATCYFPTAIASPVGRGTAVLACVVTCTSRRRFANASPICCPHAATSFWAFNRPSMHTGPVN